MNKEIQVLYTIFELELTPPFGLIQPAQSFGILKFIYNKHSEIIGWYGEKNMNILIEREKEISILRKVKQVFNVDELSNEDVYHIAKHLFNWLQDNFPDDVILVRIGNRDTNTHVYYP